MTFAPGTDVLVWLHSGPVPGWFISRGRCEGEKCVFVRLRNSDQVVPCDPEIVTEIGGVLDAYDRGSRLVRVWGNA